MPCPRYAVAAAAIIVCTALIAGCTLGAKSIKSPLQINSTPKYTGEVSPIKVPVNIVYGPFIESKYTKNTRFNAWKNGELETGEEITTGTYEAVHSGVGVEYKFTDVEKKITVNVYLDESRSSMKVIGARVDGERFDVNSSKNSRQLATFERIIAKFLPKYKKSNIVDGDIIFDDKIQISGALVLFKLRAIGLVNYGGRKSLLVEVTGGLMVNNIDGTLGGFEIIDLETGMVTLSELYMSVQDAGIDFEGNGVKRLILPPTYTVENNHVEINVTDWLKLNNLEKYVGLFHRNEISVDVLPELTDSDLREIGIESLGARKRILKAAKKL